MIFLDTSLLVDFLDADRDRHGAARRIVSDRRERGSAFAVPAPVLYELYRGAAAADGADGVKRMESDLAWTTPVDQTAAAAREAALIYAALRAEGRMINEQDVVIAGIVREAGGTLVTADGDFDAVPELDVEAY